MSLVALSPRSLGWLAWVALVPLFVCLRGASWRSTMAVGIVYTLVLALGGLEPWFARSVARYFGLGIGRAVVMTALPLAAISVVHGGVLGALLLCRPRRAGTWDVVWCGALWPCWEALRKVIVPFYPAGILALSQHASIPVLQVASVCGVAGVSFVLAGCNAGLAALLTGSPLSGRPRAAALTGLALAVAAAGGGALRLSGAPNPEAAPGPRVALVDVGATQWSASTLDRYLAASEPAIATQPTLLVWPESALTVDVEHDRVAWNALDGFVRAHNTPLLAGGVGSARRAGGEVAHFNSAHLLTPGHGMRSYHKRGLVALAERWPAFLGTPPPDLASLSAGREETVFTVGETAFGVLICFEITDAAGARALARAGARFLVNLTNDAWFIGSARPPHLPWAPVRAVETGLPVVRAANAGPSAIFDRFGRPVAVGRSTGTPTFLLATVPPAAPTVYARTGDVFFAACIVVVLAGTLRALARATRRR